MNDEKTIEQQEQMSRHRFKLKVGEKLKEIFCPGRRLFTDDDYQKLFSEFSMFLYDEILRTIRKSENIISIYSKIVGSISEEETEAVIKKLVNILKSNSIKIRKNG